MSQNKLTVGLVCGGKSGEHEVSLISAKNIYAALDRSKYDVVVLGIEKNGIWRLSHDESFLKSQENVTSVSLDSSKPAVFVGEGGMILDRKSQQILETIDVFFPITHGVFGEDGTLQGMLRMLNVPYVGPDVLGSAIGMDKDVSKRLLKEGGIAVTPFITLRAPETISFNEAVTKLGLPLFVKPCRQGSSVGVSKVKNAEEFKQALTLAFRHDRKILIEQGVTCREIECSVLGNENPQVSDVFGEIVPLLEFYSYEAKYVSAKGAELKIPADVAPEILDKMRQCAVASFKMLECEGMARIDFFLLPDGTFYLNEINTLPGFTNISMYPKLWEASGVSYAKLLDNLINLALRRFQWEAQIFSQAQ